MKCGSSNSVYCEQIQKFKRHLEKLNIPYKIIDRYVSYFYGYMKDKNNNTDFSRQLSSYEYKKLYQDKIEIFNESINKTRIIIDVIDRFLVRGKN